MKRIVASVGLVALGTSGLHAATASSLVAPDTKPWSVSATLRGFYDDNINSAPDKSPLTLSTLGPGGTVLNTVTYHRGSFGFEVSPAAVLTLAPSEQTKFTAGYVYSFKEYENKPFGSADNNDQTHTFNASLDHAFNELYSVNARDSFVIGQQPDFLRTGNIYTDFARVPGNNIRNFGNINLDGRLTRLLGFEVGYANALYDYSDTSATASQPSTAGVLNRMEQTVHLDTRWQVLPETVFIVGYQFGDTDYTHNELLGSSTFQSTDRNNQKE